MKDKNNKKIIFNKPIRVLHKSLGKSPTVKTITNVKKLKKLIIDNTLKMVRYENYIIICINHKQNKCLVPNIVLDFYNVSGDFIFVGYDSKNKDFKSLSLEEIEYYIEELSRKSFNIYTYRNFLVKNIIKDKRKNNIPIEKITISPISSDKKDCETVESHKKVYANLCDKYGLDPKKGQLVIPTSNENKTKDSLELILRIQNDILKFIKKFIANNDE